MKKSIPAQLLFCLILGFASVMVPSEAHAQLAPTGGHYAGRRSDTGYEPGIVNTSGGYSVSVPLDLPAARGGLPIPLQIVSGTRGVGAAGLGWDIPLSYVRRDTSIAHRRPAFGSERDTQGFPLGREQVSLSLQGQTVDLVRKGQEWVARVNAPDLVLREQDGTWVLFDGQGRTYFFMEPQNLAGSGLWLLRTVNGAGGTNVQLDYDVTTSPVLGGKGVAINLIRVLYNTHPDMGCAKNEVTLSYGSAAASPLSLFVLGDKVLVRTRTLLTVDVKSRATCSDTAQSLRRYELTYQPDADTQQPRLRSVQMLGRQGTTEEFTALPIATYGYGSATKAGKLPYKKSQSIALPTSVDRTEISSTQRDGPGDPDLPTQAGGGYTTWQSLTDVTGDGRPDLTFKKDGKLWVARNRPGADGRTIFSTPSTAQLSDSTFSKGPFETRSATNNRFTYGANNINVDQVWRQAIDVNGDGRVDIIDAAEEPKKWIIYLNTPGSGASGVKWERREYSILTLYNELGRLGHSVFNNFLPLASRFTSRDRIVSGCWKFDGHKWEYFQGGFGHGCQGGAQDVFHTGPEATFTEWEIKDINADGYPDVVFNSSPVDMVMPVPDAQPGDQVNAVKGSQVLIRVQPKAGAGNIVRAVFNTRGMSITNTALNPFSIPVDIKRDTGCGVGLWAESLGTQHVVCGIDDVNGDGLPDRIEARNVFLGTGRRFSSIHLTLPGHTLAMQQSPQVAACSPPHPRTTTYFAVQEIGLRDLTGDGIPDYIESTSNGFQVSIGTGTGFAPPVAVEGGFSFSVQKEICDGTISQTVSGLYDINGDGKPEMVHVNAQNLDVYQLTGGTTPGTPEAGRLEQIDNGYGAKTSITYRSAKEDPTTLHQVPFPEVVVASVETTGTQGLGGTLSATRFAYGNAELMFDSARDSFTLPAYGRVVELRILPKPNPTDRTEAMATLTDTYPLAPFIDAPKNERFGRYLRAGRVRDVTVLSGSISTNPWSLLTTDISTDSHLIGSTHYDWETKFFQEPAVPSNDLCLDMMHPLDFEASFVANSGPNGYNVCSAHGFIYGSATESWRGDEAPPSTRNVATRSLVREIDDFGRVTLALMENDRFRSDDDLCVETKFAQPIGQNERVLFAPVKRRIWHCNDKSGVFPTYAAESYEYDNLAVGQVAAGLVTSHSVERRATDLGTFLNTVRKFDIRYDSAANPVTITSKREDDASRTVRLEYEPFGLAPVRVRIEATNTRSNEVRIARDPISLDALSTTDPNLIKYGIDFDGFGRMVRLTIQAPGGQGGVLSMVSYLGFTGADPLGRRISGKSFTDPVTLESVDSAAGRTRTLFIDELGRERRTEIELGPDYANEKLIVDMRRYDRLGRVTFAADPFPKSEDAATAYGTTYYFKADGSPSCFIRGRGRQPLTALPDDATERFPTCYTRSFFANQETRGVRDAASLQASSPQAGVEKFTTSTAIGWPLSRFTMKSGTRLELATFTHDRLGNLTGMKRFQDAAASLNPVQWSWRFDSLGQLLQLQEPESNSQFNRYSNWGELIEVTSTDFTTSPATNRRVRNTYDALSRITHREEQNNGVTDPETVNDYGYDAGVSVSPLVTPANVQGRLAQAKAPRGDVFFSYDAFGRVNAQTFTDNQGGTYIEKTRLHADGTPAALELLLPDTGHKPEIVDYDYDSAAELRSMKFSDGARRQDLYEALEIDPFGRVRKARYGDNTVYTARYADVGRRLMKEVSVSSPRGSRRIIRLGFDTVGREKVRREIKDGAATGPKTNVGYDALGRVSTVLQTNGAETLSNRQFSYDALGNTLGLVDAIGTNDATLSYGSLDRDRICRIGYGDGGLGGTPCNVLHDGFGNIVQQPTRNGQRKLSYFVSGQVRTITEQDTQASFHYDAFGEVQELDLQGGGIADTRHDRRYGQLIERRDVIVGTATNSVISRQIPGPGGIVASRRGPSNDWVFQFAEQRGNRFFTDASGAFVQDLAYAPFGETKSTGAQPGSAQYSNLQWNGRDALAAFGLSQLGARVYDPNIGRFLSRDPLLVPRTAGTTNPYAFAMNDPLNGSDGSGLDCYPNFGKECEGPGGGFPPGLPGGGPTDINWPVFKFPREEFTGANSQAAYRAPTPTIFHTILGVTTDLLATGVAAGADLLGVPRKGTPTIYYLQGPDVPDWMLDRVVNDPLRNAERNGYNIERISHANVWDLQYALADPDSIGVVVFAHGADDSDLKLSRVKPWNPADRQGKGEVFISPSAIDDRFISPNLKFVVLIACNGLTVDSKWQAGFTRRGRVNGPKVYGYDESVKMTHIWLTSPLDGVFAKQGIAYPNRKGLGDSAWDLLKGLSTLF